MMHIPKKNAFGNVIAGSVPASKVVAPVRFQQIDMSAPTNFNSSAEVLGIDPTASPQARKQAFGRFLRNANNRDLAIYTSYSDREYEANRQSQLQQQSGVQGGVTRSGAPRQ